MADGDVAAGAATERGEPSPAADRGGLGERRARLDLLATVAWLLVAVFSLGGTVLAALNGWPLIPDPWAILLVGGIVTGTLGAIVARRRTGVAIGWLMLGMGVLDAVAAFALQYGYRATIVEPGSIPVLEGFTTGTYGVAVGAVFGTTITFFLLLFPDGRLPSPRWRPLAWIAGAGIATMVVGLTAFTVDVGTGEMLERIAAGGLDAGEATGWHRTANEIGHLLVFLVFPAAVVSLFVRRRRADETARKQLEWFAYGSAIFLTSVFAPLPEPFSIWYEVAATGFLYVAIAVAVLRYRLYEIDRIVSRTVSYAVVTAVLAAVYVSSVFTLGRLLPAEADLAVAASTLAVAALFAPVRRRAQSLVDRRFNRTRYDAARTVEDLSRRLRDELDAEELAGELGQVTATAFEPLHLSMWLREQRS